jgi:hypothetical protein
VGSEQGFGLEEAQVTLAGASILKLAKRLGKASQLFRTFGAIFNGRNAFEFLGEFEGEAFCEMGVEADAAFSGIELAILNIELAQANPAVFLKQPIAKAAVTPLGDVIIGNGMPGETFGEDALDYRQGVQPGNQVATKSAVVEALVEFLADGAGKARDFSGSCSHGNGV